LTALRTPRSVQALFGRGVFFLRHVQNGLFQREVGEFGFAGREARRKNPFRKRKGVSILELRC